ncbi:hypothetical protein [Actinomadura flavalba]|uniref:hypothetical protein n=1 Tax=Actinomadura flavalba TaxID=1120938 RepID=UPI0003772A50|nr:hypothetical protein [Actinomadura flavalba]
MTARLALALPVPLLLAAACSGADSRPGPAIGRAQAERVLARYTLAADAAGRTLDGTRLASVTTGPQLAMDLASLKLRRATKSPAGGLRFDRTTYLIPRLHGYPRWFAVDAMSSGGTQSVRHALLFTQSAEGAAWLLAADPLPVDGALNRVALDTDGFATAPGPEATGPAMAPARVAAAHAALLTGGAEAPGAKGIAPGPHTTRAHRALRAGSKKLRKRGILLSSEFAPHTTPFYALRTEDGGALVWYVLRQTEAYAAARAGKLSVSGDLTGLAPTRAPRTRLNSTVLIQYLATVPPRGPATVSGIYRKAVSAQGS